MATILVIDDHPSNREFLVTLLGYSGHHVLEAADALEGIGQTRTVHPDLVIADILMPAIDGFEFVRRLRASPEIAQTRVIFYTATYLESEARGLARACGVSHVIVKPAEPQKILDIVALALSNGQPAPASPPDAEFDREHQRLLVDKLAQKTDELQNLNAELERRVQARTAELAAANARLDELNRLKDELLAITSHDLRTPLGAIKNMAEMLLEEDLALPDDPHRRFLQHICDAAERLIGLVSNLLDLARIEAGQAQPEYFELYISEIVRQVVAALSLSAKAKALDIQLTVAPGEPLLQGDALRLWQVFHNLLNNAIKFTPQGGQIYVTVEPEPGGVQVNVADTGMGIPPTDLPYLFEKFKQTHARGTAGETGSGLGLAIVRQLVELHGGFVEVASEVGHGSIFTIHLPQGPESIGMP
jgi:signal transduction histidine kinase